MQAFNTKLEAVEYMDGLVKDGHMDRFLDTYSETGVYTLNHGETSRPDYKPTRYKNGWGFKRIYSYYSMSGGPVDSRVEITYDAYTERLDIEIEEI